MFALNTEPAADDVFAAPLGWEDHLGSGWAHAHTCPAGTELFAQGSAPRAVHRLECGLVKLTRVQEAGHEMIVGLRRAPWMLGSAEALLERSYATTATTLKRCRLRSLSAAGFRRLVRTDARMSWQVHRMLSREVYEQAELAALACLPARRRLEHFLDELVRAEDAGAVAGWFRLQLPLKQQELAQLLAVTREHLNRMLKQLEGEGLIRRHKGWLLISDSAEPWHEHPDGHAATAAGALPE